MNDLRERSDRYEFKDCISYGPCDGKPINTYLRLLIIFLLAIPIAAGDGLRRVPPTGAEEKTAEEGPRGSNEDPVAERELSAAKLGDLVSRGAVPKSSSEIAVVAFEDELPDGESGDEPKPKMLPLAMPSPVPGVDMQHAPDDSVSLVATEADLVGVLRMIAEHHQVNLIIAPGVGGPVTVQIRDARLEEVLDAILGVAGFTWHREGNLLYVTTNQPGTLDARIQGRLVQVYPLNYVAARDVEAVANGLLSPIGNAYVTESSEADHMKTQELLIVEDTLAVHHRIAQCISQIDVMPRQVLVEAHVLQVSLGNDDRHGVNWKGLARIANSDIELEGSGFASDPADGGSGPSMALRVRGKDMSSLIEWIEQNTNSRTLASPKLSVVNHQEAKIQIGQRLPFSVATTTQTTTVQSVQFLEVGVVLTVEPVITNDGHVLMRVLPKVSGGKIASNGFPEEETTEVQTTILMPDGGGVIIGGLIREEEVHNEASVPVLGRIPLLGRLFRKRTNEMRRNEVIVALVTHILPEGECSPRAQECLDIQRTVPHYADINSLLPFQQSVPIETHATENQVFESSQPSEFGGATMFSPPVTTAVRQ